ncbi:hypothetical protein ACIG54_14525 [Streptomyces achromogenes]|uniref:hypothetical protein n=1 Tax=Streptomyces achromogenes TaxID=67255 RepID=UPI00344577BB
MRNSDSTRRNSLRTIAVASSLTLAASAAAMGTAHAAVKVTITGTVSCAQFEDSSPKTVTITPRRGTADSDEPPGEGKTEPYTVRLTGIPNGGTTATVRVVCVDDDGDPNTYKKKNVPITKPADGSALKLNLPG